MDRYNRKKGKMDHDVTANSDNRSKNPYQMACEQADRAHKKRNEQALATSAHGELSRLSFRIYSLDISIAGKSNYSVLREFDDQDAIKVFFDNDKGKTFDQLKETKEKLEEYFNKKLEEYQYR